MSGHALIEETPVTVRALGQCGFVVLIECLVVVGVDVLPGDLLLFEKLEEAPWCLGHDHLLGVLVLSDPLLLAGLDVDAEARCAILPSTDVACQSLWPPPNALFLLLFPRRSLLPSLLRLRRLYSFLSLLASPNSLQLHAQRLLPLLRGLIPLVGARPALDDLRCGSGLAGVCYWVWFALDDVRFRATAISAMRASRSLPKPPVPTASCTSSAWSRERDVVPGFWLVGASRLRMSLHCQLFYFGF